MQDIANLTGMLPACQNRNRIKKDDKHEHLRYRTPSRR